MQIWIGVTLLGLAVSGSTGMERLPVTSGLAREGFVPPPAWRGHLTHGGSRPGSLVNSPTQHKPFFDSEGRFHPVVRLLSKEEAEFRIEHRFPRSLLPAETFMGHLTSFEEGWEPELDQNGKLPWSVFGRKSPAYLRKEPFTFLPGPVAPIVPVGMIRPGELSALSDGMVLAAAPYFGKDMRKQVPGPYKLRADKSFGDNRVLVYTTRDTVVISFHADFIEEQWTGHTKNAVLLDPKLSEHIYIPEGLDEIYSGMEATAFGYLEKYLNGFMQRFFPRRNVVVVGQSLGASLAKAFLAHIALRNPPSIQKLKHRNGMIRGYFVASPHAIHYDPATLRERMSSVFPETAVTEVHVPGDDTPGKILFEKNFPIQVMGPAYIHLNRPEPPQAWYWPTEAESLLTYSPHPGYMTGGETMKDPTRHVQGYRDLKRAEKDLHRWIMEGFAAD